MIEGINYLRMSITDRCNLRCFYCTCWQEWEKLPAAEILRYEELLQVAEVAAAAGIRKVRLTGGEPLMRRGVPEFIRRLQRVPGIEQVCLTTNGVFLADLAPALYEAGLRHLNVSLDTLRPRRYADITGRDDLAHVLAGLERAASLGFHPLKINCVVLKGLNDDGLTELASLAREHPVQVRFIELMPTGSRREWQRRFLPADEIRRRLSVLGPLAALASGNTAGPARLFKIPGFVGELGFISPMSEHHCGSCNRLRLTAQGRLRPCLRRPLEYDLKEPLRSPHAAEKLRQIFQTALATKTIDRLPLSGEMSFTHQPMAEIGG